MRSPISTNNGTCTTSPYSSVAGLEHRTLGRLARRGSVWPIVARRKRDLDADDLALKKANLGRHALDHVVGGLDRATGATCIPVVGVVVHEHVVFAVAPVEELHLLRVDDRLLDADAGVERAVEHVARLDVAQLGAHECAALARLDVWS